MGKPIFEKQYEPVKVRLLDIKEGHTFKYNDSIYMLTDDGVLNLNNGVTGILDDDTLVEPIQITITY